MTKTFMADKRRQPRFDSHQVIGAVVVFGVLMALVGMAFQRWDLALVMIFVALVVALLVGPGSRRQTGDGGGGSGFYDCDGGDGGGD